MNDLQTEMATKESTFLLSNGNRMPIIGLGMWQTDSEESVQIALNTAIDVGYRHIDTAFAYENEALIGSALQEIFKSGKLMREEMFITTKLPLNGMRHVERFFKTSLAALQLEYLDLYLLHFPVPSKCSENMNELMPMENGDLIIDKTVDLLDTWREMESLVDKGLVKSIGLCNCNSVQIQRIYDAARIKPTSLQVECHAYLPQYELLDFVQKLNMSFTGYSPLGTPGLPKFAKEKYGVDFSPDVLLADERLKSISSKYKKTNAQILLRFLVQRGIVIIPKSSNPERIKENIEVFDFYIDKEDMDLIKSMGKNYRFFDFTHHKSMVEHQEYPFNIPF